MFCRPSFRKHLHSRPQNSSGSVHSVHFHCSVVAVAVPTNAFVLLHALVEHTNIVESGSVPVGIAHQPVKVVSNSFLRRYKNIPGRHVVG